MVTVFIAQPPFYKFEIRISKSETKPLREIRISNVETRNNPPPAETRNTNIEIRNNAACGGNPKLEYRNKSEYANDRNSKLSCTAQRQARNSNLEIRNKFKTCNDQNSKLFTVHLFEY